MAHRKGSALHRVRGRVAQMLRGLDGGKKRGVTTRGPVAAARGARACGHPGQAMMKKLPVLAVVIASLPATAMAQSARSQAPPYCFDLSRIVDLAVTKERFASIAGQPRQVTFAIPVSSWPVGRTARSTERRAIPASPRRWRARTRPLRRKAQLAKRYGDQRALTDISFAVNAGEVLGLIGPNGAGKTTLMQAIAGTLATDAGQILWRGTPLPLRRRREFLFYLPDGVRPWEDQYVARVTELFAAIYGRSQAFL